MRFFASLLLLLVAACPPGTDDAGGTDMGSVDAGVDLGPPPTCATLMPIDMGPVFDGEDGGLPTMLTFDITMGDEDTATYTTVGTPWHDGDVVHLIHGLQGGWMVMPAFDVDTTADVPTTIDGYACFDLFLTNDAPDAGTLVRSYAAGVLATPIAGRPHVFHLTGQQNLLDYDPVDVEGKPVTIAVHVLGPTGEGRTTRTITPRMAAITPTP